MTSRARLREAFLSKHQWRGAHSLPLPADASFRQYFRLLRVDKTGDNTAILMDAPPEHGNIQPFLTITNHLQRLGLRVPQIFFHDADNGFILLEYLGSDTFTALLNTGMKALPLYEKAIHVLTRLQGSQHATNINTATYDFERLIDEACLLTKWYLPTVTGEPIKRQQEADYIAAWRTIYDNLPKINPTLVLRDYHLDNLMLVDGQCALLDYQDALIGSPAYDVVSLLEDARRDIDHDLSRKMLALYLQQCPQINHQAFAHHYIVWGAQRHCKVAGIFIRLWLRDNKPSYRQHLPRVLGLLQKHLHHPHLAPLNEWFKQTLE